jgi:hypothetical protein
MSGLREYDQASIDGLISTYTQRKENYLDLRQVVAL